MKIGKISVGETYNMLEVVSYAGRNKHKEHSWNCICECGTSTVALASYLTTGRKKSCGCLRVIVSTKHGDTEAPEYSTWESMRNRCNNPNNQGYHRYGGRGITVCERWDDYSHFLSDVGRRPSPQHTLDRIDNEGNYEYRNCRWAAKKEQANNRRPACNTKLYEYRGETLPLTEWAKRVGITYAAIHGRFKKGWPIERIMSKHG